VNSKKYWISFTNLGIFHLITALTFFESILILLKEITNPRKVVLVTKNLHFSSLTKSPASKSLVKTLQTCS